MSTNIPSDLILPKVLAIGASPRQGGNSDILLKQVCLGLNHAGIATEEIQLRDCQISPCIGCEGCRETGRCSRFADDMVGIYPKLKTSQGLFLISPVHNYNITAWMKAFIDRLYCFYNFDIPRPGPWSSKLAGQGRKALVAAVAEQRQKEEMGFTLEAMQRPMEALGYQVIDTFAVLKMFDKGRVLEHPDILQQAEQHGTALADALKA
ncbi:MAG: flavodoxin family protein [Desulfuromonas sp.]|nr:MAG: flavodoxin family protein [Desulfuromonas sp.]